MFPLFGLGGGGMLIGMSGGRGGHKVQICIRRGGPKYQL